jgi:predicted phage terminase large subunit-like protein
MGRGGEIGLIDDPFKSWEDAQKESARERVWEWYTGTFYNRIRPGGAIIVINHRMHEDDLAARLIAQMKAGGDRWHIIEIPADLECPPWPERYDREALERLKAVSGPRKWSALFMQKPTPAEGTYFKREWFRRYTPEMLPKSMHHYLTSDHAPAGGENSDFNCFRMWGLNGPDVYLLDGFRKQETMDVAMDRVVGIKAKKVKGLLQRYKPLAWFPEDDNNWKAVAGFVTRTMRTEGVYVRIEPITPNGADKEIKAMAFQAMASSGCVWIPAGPEGDEIIEQYVAFPGGKNDDEVDAGAVIGRAIDDAHPAIANAPQAPEQSGGDYEPEREEETWKVA